MEVVAENAAYPAKGTSRGFKPAQMPDRLILNRQVVRAVEVSMFEDTADTIHNSKTAYDDEHSAESTKPSPTFALIPGPE